MNWDRLDAIEAMSPADRQAFAERLAWELVRPGGMDKRDAIPHTPTRFVPVKRDRKTVSHGTISGYTYGKCRCDECRAAKAAYQRENSDKLANERFEPVERPPQARLSPAKSPRVVTLPPKTHDKVAPFKVSHPVDYAPSRRGKTT